VDCAVERVPQSRLPAFPFRHAQTSRSRFPSFPTTPYGHAAGYLKSTHRYRRSFSPLLFSKVSRFLHTPYPESPASRSHTPWSFPHLNLVHSSTPAVSIRVATDQLPQCWLNIDQTYGVEHTTMLVRFLHSLHIIPLVESRHTRRSTSSPSSESSSSRHVGIVWSC
jgi:hypothetical protein